MFLNLLRSLNPIRKIAKAFLPRSLNEKVKRQSVHTGMQKFVSDSMILRSRTQKSSKISKADNTKENVNKNLKTFDQDLSKNSKGQKRDPVKSVVSPKRRKHLSIQFDGSEKASTSSEKQVKTERQKKEKKEIVESIIWQPENWEEVLDNIRNMRKWYKAPVDTMGSEQCADRNASPKDSRYQTLVSLMLSSQTKDQVTHAAVQRLIAHGLTIENILETSDEKLGELIYPVGFWRSKVKYIKNATKILKDQYDSDIPSSMKELCKLPGVGPKMANLAMTIAWNQTVGIAVDTHVHRICNRLGWVKKPTKEPEQTRVALESWLPRNLWSEINLILVGFGQTICNPVHPKCQECLNRNICPVGKKTSVPSGSSKHLNQ